MSVGTGYLHGLKWPACWMNFRANIWHPSLALTCIMDGIQHPRNLSGIKDGKGSFESVGNPFGEDRANCITLDTKLMTSAEGMNASKEAEAMDVQLSKHSTKSKPENQSESVNANEIGKQPVLSQLWLGKDFMRWIYCSQARLRTCHSERYTLQEYMQDVFDW